MWVRRRESVFLWRMLQSDGPEQGRTGSKSTWSHSERGLRRQIRTHLPSRRTVLRSPWLEDALHKHVSGESMLSGRQMDCTQSMDTITWQKRRWIRNVEVSCIIVDMLHTYARWIRPCPAWQRRASTCGRALLPHADKHMFVYVLELCSTLPRRTRPKPCNLNG
jgi:hypothetical protein